MGCDSHPKEEFVGVCPSCLTEKLLILAEKQRQENHGNAKKQTSLFRRNLGSSRSSSSFPKIFAFGSYFFLKNWKSEGSDYQDCASSSSQDDSFISIKFEDDGHSSWDKGKEAVSKVSLENCKVTTWNHSLRKETPNKVKIEHLKVTNNNKESKSVIEHANTRSSLRWRKRIGHLFQLMRWKRTSKSHVGTKVDGVKVRKGWMRNLTKRRT